MTNAKEILFTTSKEQGNVVRSHLRAAMECGIIWPAFQPIVSIRNGALVGFEILARWRNFDNLEVSPSTFIPLYERYGLIDSLSDTMMERACAVAASWQPPFFLAFNLSPGQLTHKNLPKRLSAIANRTGFPLHRVQVEITENSCFPDEEVARHLFRKLSELGVKIVVDDFGTGYSNLARLESFPFDKLKIDVQFVHGLAKDAGKRRIAAAVIGLGHSLGLAVVAEGVETPEDEAILRAYGCDLGQGWLYGAGVSADEAERLLQVASRQGDVLLKLDNSPFQQRLQLESLYRQAPVGLCFVDLEYRHIRVNQRFASIHGMEASELEGKSIFEIMPEEKAEAIKAILLESLGRGTAVSNLRCAYGQEYIFFSSQVVDVDGSVVGFSVVSLDVALQVGVGRVTPLGIRSIST